MRVRERGGTDQNSTRQFIECIDDYPTANQPISDTTLKDMLVSLRGSLHRDMISMVIQNRAKVDAIGERVDRVENKMGEYAEAHNELVDAHNSPEEEMHALKIKLADLEDCSRRNNGKFRGIDESVPPAELHKCIQQLISDLLPETPKYELVMDRAHELPKPAYL